MGVWIVKDTLSSGDFKTYADRVRNAGIKALRVAIVPVRDQVKAFTPVWKGGLRDSIFSREENGGRDQVVFSTSPIVASVHERNAKWSKYPPDAPIRAWVQSKLNVMGKGEMRKAMKQGVSNASGVFKRRLDSVVFMVRRKIFDKGLTLPNREGKGIMFGRTVARMQSRAFYMRGYFIAKLKEELIRNAMSAGGNR